MAENEVAPTIPAEQPPTGIPDVDPVVEAVEEPVAEEVVAEEPAAEEPASEEEAKPEPSDEDEPSDMVFNFQGVDLQVDVTPEITQEFASKGLDATALTKELYSSEDFSLTPETLEKVNAIYGEFAVSSYIAGLKAQNEMGLQTFNKDVEDAKTAADTAWSETQSIIGEDEGAWDKLSDFGASTLSEQELADWDMIMKGDNWYMQRLAIKDLHARSQEAGDEQADTNVHPAQSNGSMTGVSNESLELIEAAGGDNRSTGSGGAVTAAELQAAFTDGSYYADTAGWDARRRAGMAKGI